MQEIIVYILIGLAAAIVLFFAIKHFIGKKDTPCLTCEGCALKENCKSKIASRQR